MPDVVGRLRHHHFPRPVSKGQILNVAVTVARGVCHCWYCCRSVVVAAPGRGSGCSFVRSCSNGFSTRSHSPVEPKVLTVSHPPACLSACAFARPCVRRSGGGSGGGSGDPHKQLWRNLNGIEKKKLGYTPHEMEGNQFRGNH